MDMLNIGGLAKNALEEALRERGHANVLIVGRTGVGKSTLINSVFQGNLATTGQGRPVTQDTREITKEDIPLTIFDTRGLRLHPAAQTLPHAALVFCIERARREFDAWLRPQRRRSGRGCANSAPDCCQRAAGI